MKRLVTVITVLTVLGTSASAARPGSRLTFGAEWGFNAQVIDYHRFTYKDQYGSIVPDRHDGFAYNGNLYILLNAGVTVSDRSVVSLQSGIEGVAKNRNIIPVRLKYSFLPSGVMSDGALLFAAAGIGFPGDRHSTPVPSIGGQVGAGYRINLAGKTNIEFFGSFKATYDHPGIIDKASGEYVPVSRIIKNDAFYGSVSVGLAVNF